MRQLKGELDAAKAVLARIDQERLKANADKETHAKRDQIINERLHELTAEIDELKELKRRHEMASQKAYNVVEDYKQKYPWILGEKEFFGIAATKYHFDKINLPKIREECKRLREDNDSLKKKVNLKVDAMFEKTYQQYEELKKKKETTFENKQKF
jgi:chromosome segregation ATPase